MSHKILFNLITVSALLLSATAYGQVTDTIRPDNHRLQTGYLTTGLKQYLVYVQDVHHPKVLRQSLWTRNIIKTTLNGKPVIEVVQHWYSGDTSAYRYIRSVQQQQDFQPVYHTETIGSKTKAYNWYANRIESADTIAGNQQKDFKLPFARPNFNWNLDIETFEMLPLAAGKKFAVSFYDAGLTPPDFEVLTVTGSEVLATLNSQKVDCWLLQKRGEYKGTVYTQTFWISKQGHEMLKEEDNLGNGLYRYKVKLPALVPNVPKAFASGGK